jgi:hypothetical protein
MYKLKRSSRIIHSTMVFLMILYVSCVSISRFDQYAYDQTASIKVDALKLMDLATNDYPAYQTNDQEFQAKLKKIYDYEKTRSKNDVSIKLWDKLIDPNGHLLGGFLSRWKAEQKLNGTFITEEKKLVDKAFDQIIELESKKAKP